jgi:hypothetical protein
MEAIMSWVRGTSGWVRSPFGDLPSLRADDTPAHQTWLILAGGIALILSRASRSELETRFAASRLVYALAHGRLHKRRLPKPDPNLLRDALREIANLADPMTKEAGRECMARAVERVSGKERAGASGPSTASSSAPPASSLAATQMLSTQAAAGHDREDNEATQIDLDLLFERSNKLRGTVAFARSTTFGQDS